MRGVYSFAPAMAPFVADAQTSEHQIGAVSGLRVSNGAGFRGAVRADTELSPLMPLLVRGHSVPLLFRSW